MKKVKSFLSNIYNKVKVIDIREIFSILGLIMLATGITLHYGLSITLMVIGSILMLLGIFSFIRGVK